ncbi:MAG: ParA family protein [Gammaproteobacteria bacterium]|nr:ParA family protein [Gammaproteobacteria bacterium]MBT7542100.1 ParA family protein [Gammaproteobacteria bacterium]
MALALAITNQKGGVGKTTTSVNLSASLAAMKRRVLLVDLDPQGNATMGSGVDKSDLDASVYDILVNGLTVSEAKIEAESAGFDLLGSNVDLTGAEIELLSMDRREFRLKDALMPVQASYDYIVIDCPPSLSLLTINGLVASDTAMIPMQCEYYALEGLSALINTISRITASLNPDLEVEGIVRTMYDPRNSLTKDVSDQLANHFGEKLYRTVIPRNVRLAEAPSYGLPVLYYDKQSRGARAYLALASELARRYEGIDNANGVGTRDDSSGTDAAIDEKNRTQKQW